MTSVPGAPIGCRDWESFRGQTRDEHTRWPSLFPQTIEGVVELWTRSHIVSHPKEVGHG